MKSMNKFLITFIVTSLFSFSSFSYSNEHTKWKLNPQGVAFTVSENGKASAMYSNGIIWFPGNREKCDPSSYSETTNNHVVSKQLVKFRYFCAEDTKTLDFIAFSPEGHNFIFDEFSNKNKVTVKGFTFNAKGFNKAVVESDEILSKGAL